MKKLLAVLLLLVLAAQPLLCMSTASAGSPNQTAVAYMEARFQCGCTWNGCGTMIAKNGLITAGHCLVCFTHNKPLKSCNFYFKRQKSGTCFYKYTGKFSAYSYADFSSGYSMEDDIGYVVFPTNIGNETGWYASSAESDYDINWEFCHMYGYSGGGMISDWAQVNVVNSKTVSWEASSEFRSGTQGGCRRHLQLNPLHGREFQDLILRHGGFRRAGYFSGRLRGNPVPAHGVLMVHPDVPWIPGMVFCFFLPLCNTICGLLAISVFCGKMLPRPC